MRYEVHFLVGGEEHAQEIEAPDAAEAASLAESLVAPPDDGFELLSINLIDPLTDANGDGNEAESAFGD